MLCPSWSVSSLPPSPLLAGYPSVKSLARSGPGLGVPRCRRLISLPLDLGFITNCDMQTNLFLFIGRLMCRCIGSRNSNQMSYTSSCMGPEPSCWLLDGVSSDTSPVLLFPLFFPFSLFPIRVHTSFQLFDLPPLSLFSRPLLRLALSRNDTLALTHPPHPTHTPHPPWSRTEAAVGCWTRSAQRVRVKKDSYIIPLVSRLIILPLVFCFYPSRGLSTSHRSDLRRHIANSLTFSSRKQPPPHLFRSHPDDETRT